MKKIVTILVCLLLVASFAVTAFAADLEMTLTADKTNITRGDVVILTIAMPELAGCKSGGFMLEGKYDTDVFEFVEEQSGCPLDGTMLEKVGYTGGKLSGSFMYASATTVSGPIFNIALKVKDTAPFGKTTVAPTVSARTSADVVATVNSLELTVVCANHTPETTTTKEATCSEAGEKVTTCTTCNAELSKETVAKLPHTPVTTTTKEATCSEAGEKVTTCSVCREELEKVAVAKLPHTPVTTTTKEATCSEAGEKVTTCSVCQEELEKVVIEKLAHTLGEFTETKAPTCSEAGEKSATCSVCDETVTEAIEKLAHTWDEGKVTTEPTTKAEGVKTYTCTVCGETKTEAIAKLETPKTSDDSMIVPFVLLMILSAAGVAVTVIGKKRAI